jgi:CRISPR/Cas system-associated exonuclease Cas4 (RecB family)
MDSFLAQVARTLYDKYGDDISSLEIVFPSRRARLFFEDELTKIARRPLWQPHFLSLDEVAENLAGMRSGDHTRLITELYKAYSRHHNESFDSFYFWGEMLLSDFDSVDKYLLDADILFANVADLKLLEAEADYLTDEQRSVIARFWSSFGPRADYSEQQKKFIEIWTTLAPVYHEFRAALAAENLAYSGMVHRVAAEKIRRGEASMGDSRRYVVAGFNALSACEKIIFDYLASSHEVEFFWDWDHYYVDNKEQEAGLFLRENLRRYPPKTPLPDDFRNFTRHKYISVVSTPSDSLQCKYITDFLREHAGADKETAIVLTDENLLTAVLNAIPPEVEAVNVTMGYPLKSTLEYSFLERLITLQSRRGERGFHRDDVQGLESHLLSKGLVEAIMTPTDEGWRALADYLKNIFSIIGGNKDFTGIILENINKLQNSLAACGVELSTSTFASLLRRVLQSVSIPFEGEPLRGVQIMGILETRNLDFKNVLLLSATDDTFPGARATAASFIPHNLRLAYGLPTPLHHEGVYAYYFYRLLQRADNVHISYSSHADQRSSGEQSRYIYQLEYESPHRIERREIGLDVGAEPAQPITIAKTPQMLPRTLSPTSFFNFVQCPLKYYFRSVAGLRAAEEETGEIDAPKFGTILHKAMELFHRGAPSVEEAVDGAIELAAAEPSGELLLAREIVIKYIRGSILPYDERHEAVVEELEKPLSASVGGVQFTGFADRVDRLPDGRARIVDYKTGTPNLEFKGLEALFSPETGDQNPAALQTLLYAMMFAHTTGRDVQPALYYVRAMRAPDYSPLLVNREKGAQVISYAPYREKFEELLSNKIAELLDPERPFTQCADPTPCAWCDYNTICQRS